MALLTNSTSFNEKELVQSINQGNSRAFEYAFKKYYPELARFALSILRNEVWAEEIVQEVFIKIWEKRNDFRIQTGLKPYLYTAVKNRSLNHLKNKANQHSSLDQTHKTPTQTSTADQKLSEQELKKILQDAIQQLPEKCRIIFILSRNHKFSYQEIAQKLGISKKTVEAQMGIALKKLRAYLQKHWDNIPL